MPRLPHIGHLRLHAGVLGPILNGKLRFPFYCKFYIVDISLVVLFSYCHQQQKKIHRMDVLILIWTTLHCWPRLWNRIRFIMWPRHPHWQKLLDSLLLTSPSVTQLVHCFLERLPLKLLVKATLGIYQCISLYWWVKVGAFIHRIRNRKKYSMSTAPDERQFPAHSCIWVSPQFFTNRIFLPKTFHQSIK